jgi:hypothetical protein
MCRTDAEGSSAELAGRYMQKCWIRTSENAPFHALGLMSLFEALCSVARGDVEHHHTHDDQGNGEDVYRSQDLLPDHQPQENRSHRSKPRPYGVGDSQRDVLEALGPISRRLGRTRLPLRRRNRAARTLRRRSDQRFLRLRRRCQNQHTSALGFTSETPGHRVAEDVPRSIYYPKIFARPPLATLPLLAAPSSE